MPAVRRNLVKARYDAEFAKYDRATRRLNQLVSELVEDLGQRHGVRPGAAVEGKPKPFDRFWNKVLRKKARGEIVTVDDCFTQIGDIARARIVCQTLDDCDRIESLLLGHEEIYVDDQRTERYNPSTTGYRAVHFSVGVEVVVDAKKQAVTCELQVMTVLQSAWGHFTHEDFYKGKNVDPLVADLMALLSDGLYVADQQANRLIREIGE